MESRREDIQIRQWKLIRKIYHHQFPYGKDRERNEREAYWCRPAGDHQELFKAHPQQRIFARLLKSYQNTTWHQIQLSIPKQRADEKKRKIQKIKEDL